MSSFDPSVNRPSVDPSTTAPIESKAQGETTPLLKASASKTDGAGRSVLGFIGGVASKIVASIKNVATTIGSSNLGQAISKFAKDAFRSFAAKYKESMKPGFDMGKAFTEIKELIRQRKDIKAQLDTIKKELKCVPPGEKRELVEKLIIKFGTPLASPASYRKVPTEAPPVPGVTAKNSASADQEVEQYAPYDIPEEWASEIQSSDEVFEELERESSLDDERAIDEALKNLEDVGKELEEELEASKIADDKFEKEMDGLLKGVKEGVDNATGKLQARTEPEATAKKSGKARNPVDIFPKARTNYKVEVAIEKRKEIGKMPSKEFVKQFESLANDIQEEIKKIKEELENTNLPMAQRKAKSHEMKSQLQNLVRLQERFTSEGANLFSAEAWAKASILSKQLVADRQFISGVDAEIRILRDVNRLDSTE